MQNNDNREEKQISKDRIVLLDAYFAYRHNNEGKDRQGRPYIRERKTSVEIADELKEMLDVTREELFVYMRKNGYKMRQSADGTLGWEIWRELIDSEYF